MKRLDYEAPTMEEIVVEMENGFLAASGDNMPTSSVTIEATEHEQGATFDASETDWTVQQ